LLATRVRPISASSAARLALASDEQLVASIRDDDPAAFEALYERHSRELLSFCLYMLGSRADAEEALQVTFASAYRALLADERPVALRAWLFTIARNQCLSILRRRRPTVELDGEQATAGDPFREVELREEVRDALAGVRELPERQRAAMVMAEIHGLSQAEIGGALGLRADQVKALVYQARSNLISDRRARDTDCGEIRAELASARGAALLKGRLRRHVRACPDCRTYADGVARERRRIGALLPFAPWLALKFRTLQEAITSAGGEPVAYAGGTTLGGTVAGAALIAGGSIKAVAVKVVAGAALLGLSTGLGAPVMSAPSVHRASSVGGLLAKPAWPSLVQEGGGAKAAHHGAAITGAGGPLGGAFGIGGTTLAPGGGGATPPSVGITGFAEGGGDGRGGGNGAGHAGGGGHAVSHVVPVAASAGAVKASHAAGLARRETHMAGQLANHELSALQREEAAAAQQQRQLEQQQKQIAREQSEKHGSGEGATAGGEGSEGAGKHPRLTEEERLAKQERRTEREESHRLQQRQAKSEHHARSVEKAKQATEHRHALAKRKVDREKTKKQAESRKHREELRREHQRKKHHKGQSGKPAGEEVQ
jgi:RNA polymerase sigma factor (sigma-70 family)